MLASFFLLVRIELMIEHEELNAPLFDGRRRAAGGRSLLPSVSTPVLSPSCPAMLFGGAGTSRRFDSCTAHTLGFHQSGDPIGSACAALVDVPD